MKMRFYNEGVTLVTWTIIITITTYNYMVNIHTAEESKCEILD